MRNAYVWVLALMCSLGDARAAFSDSAPCTCSSPDGQYVLGPDSQPQPNIPEGSVSEFRLQQSKAYPGFEFTWWLYVPAQYDGKQSIALMVFQDGTEFVMRDGDFRVPVVLNNLIAKRELPLMAAVFVDPGEASHGAQYAKATDGSPLIGDTYRISARSREYESLSAYYADFLVDEILPQVRKRVKITDNPEGRGVGGLSSGANCALTVAWERPDQFRKVFSAIGSFPSVLRGVPGLPQLLRGSEHKPLRIFLQDGTNDVAFPFAPEWGSRAERHTDLVAALKDKGYEFQYVLGEGSHSPAQAASIFPEAMRWLWRDYPR